MENINCKGIKVFLQNFYSKENEYGLALNQLPSCSDFLLSYATFIVMSLQWFQWFFENMGTWIFEVH